MRFYIEAQNEERYVADPATALSEARNSINDYAAAVLEAVRRAGDVDVASLWVDMTVLSSQRLD